MYRIGIGIDTDTGSNTGIGTGIGTTRFPRRVAQMDLLSDHPRPRPRARWQWQRQRGRKLVKYDASSIKIFKLHYREWYRWLGLGPHGVRYAGVWYEMGFGEGPQVVKKKNRWVLMEFEEYNGENLSSHGTLGGA